MSGEHAANAAEADGPELRRVARASLVGTAIEWYDFFAYGIASALVFPAVFFPKFSPVAGTLASFATLAVGFIARPLGSVLLGHLGDRRGRKSSLVASLLLMGSATVLVGVLPGFAEIGVLAPVLLVALRFLQGVGVGGEWGGAVLIAVERAPAGRRGLFGSFAAMGVPLGLLLANGVVLLLTGLLPAGGFTAWGWRVPFLLSVALVAVGLVIRRRLRESPVYAAAERAQQRVRVPLLTALRASPGALLLAALSFVGNTAFGYMLIVFLLSYGTKTLGMPLPAVLLAVMVGSAVWLAGVPAAAVLSDRIGRRAVYLAGSVALIVWSFGLFPLLDTGSWWAAAAATAVTGLVLPLTHGPQGALFSELFPTETRYTATSLAYQLGAILGGGFAPTIAAALQAATGSAAAIGLYLAGAGVISLAAVLLLRETRHRDLAAAPGGAGRAR